MEILRVAPENVTLLWPQLKPLAEAALRSVPTHDVEDVRQSLLAMHSHLFAGMDGNTVEAFIITMFAVYPKGVWLHLWLAAALPDVPLDIERFYAVADRWREQNGCRGLQISGARKGWLKKFPQARIEGVTLRITED